MLMKEKRVLLIEDDPDHAELIIDELNTGDINTEIILKKDGQDAIDYFQRTDIDSSVRVELEIDLIISDLNMPKVHGMDVLKFLKNNSRYSSIPVIIFSTSSDPETIKKAYENGVNGYITKPISYDDFVEKLKVLIEYC